MFPLFALFVFMKNMYSTLFPIQLPGPPQTHTLCHAAFPSFFFFYSSLAKVLDHLPPPETSAWDPDIRVLIPFT